MKGGSQTTTVPPPTKEEKEYQQAQLDLAQQQLEEIKRQSANQQDMWESYRPLIEGQSTLLQSQLADLNDPISQQINALNKQYTLANLQQQTDLLPMEKELAQLQLDQIKNGNAATPEQKALIDQYTREGIISGTSDINAAASDQFRQLREFSTSAGLRPSDTPMLDRGGLVSKEALRQTGQLTSNLNSAAAQAKLNYPLAANQLTGATSSSQQGILSAAQQFQQSLSNQAVQNRLALSASLGGAVGQTGQLGLGLSSISPSWPGNSQKGSTTNFSQPTDWGGIIGGIGGAATAGAALIVF